MDWSKAKTILIIALIITNIFLLADYFTGVKDTDEIDNTEMLITMLADSEIYVSNIPNEHRSMPSLTVKYAAPGNDEVAALLESAAITVENPETGDAEEAYIEAAKDFVSYLGMMSEYAEPHFYGDVKGSAEVEFECIRNEYRIDGSYMRCIFKNGHLEAFESYWLEPVELSNRRLSTISASAALISFMTEHSGDVPVTVEKIEMVYWVDAETFDTKTMVEDTALPAWRIELANGEIVHIDAIAR